MTTCSTCSTMQDMQNEKRTLSLGLMADSWPLLILVTAAGGFSASYSFLARGGVFAFAQTGNIIYSGHVLASGRFWQIIPFLLPALSYMLGLLAARQLERRLEDKVRFQKRILLLESFLLLLTSQLPASALMTRISLCLMGCASGLQMETFHRVGDRDYTSIMVMGNMKRTVEAFGSYLEDHQPASLRKALVYILINGIFCLGSAWGYVLTQAQGDTAILLPALFLALAAWRLQPASRG